MASDKDGQFYAKLPVLDSFFEISHAENYAPLPNDWFVGITDIKNSTEAIKEKKYKRVNILGASPIVGMLNVGGKQALPYSFGGDGCVICFPPGVLDDARAVFKASQQIGMREYQLYLRTAIIPVRQIRAEGYDVEVARFRVSDFYNQAVFSGGGLEYAERILKSNEQSEYHLSATKNETIEADFSGLECRWQEVRPSQKSVITLLVKCNPEIENQAEIYDGVLNKMRDIFGFDDNTNPVSTSKLKMNMSFPKLMNETRFRSFGEKWYSRLKYLAKTEIQILIGKFLMSIGYATSVTDWDRYKEDLTLNSDHRKFDDMLRLVISGTDEQLQKLKDFLQELHEDKSLAYGIYRTDAAVITCMVFAYHREHIHFIDGSGGGYVNASKDLKKRLAYLKE